MALLIDVFKSSDGAPGPHLKSSNSRPVEFFFQRKFFCFFGFFFFLSTASVLVALLISAAQNGSLEELELKKSSQAAVLKAPQGVPFKPRKCTGRQPVG